MRDAETVVVRIEEFKLEEQIKNKRTKKGDNKLETQKAVKRANNLAGSAKHRLDEKMKEEATWSAFRAIVKICSQHNQNKSARGILALF